MYEKLRAFLSLTRSHGIARRYFIVNGFDGALTMLGLIMGFYVSENVALPVIISACLGAAVALGVSGMSSAYISEVAERKKELQELEQAMIRDLDDSAYGRASRVLPLFIAVINGFSPFLISLIIISPLWAAQFSVQLPLSPLQSAFFLALVVLFFMGVFLGRISGIFWLWAGLRTMLIAAATVALIYVLNLF